MQQPSGLSYYGASRTATYLYKQMRPNAWELFPQFDSYHASSDTSFSSSLPALAHEKMNLNELKRDHRSVASPSLKGKEVIEDVGNITSGILLPAEDELLSEIMYDFEASWLSNLVDDSEECDLFRSGGGFELELDSQDNPRAGVFNSRLSNGNVGNGGAHLDLTNGVGISAGEHPLGEHPSRTLFVRNINNDVEDAEIRSLFEQYGDIRAMHTLSKNRGFVMISYYDIRAARDALRALQSKPLQKRNLDIHYSIPKENPTNKDINQGTLVVFNLDPSVSNDELLTIFGAYGEIKEIRETPHKRSQRFIEFYDIRASEAALRSLNGSDIAGNRIKLEPSRPGGARRSLLLHDQEDRKLHHVRSLLENSPPGNRPHFGRKNSPLSSSLPGSSARSLSGQLFYGGSSETAATRAQTIMRPFIPSSNDVFPFVNNHASFCSSDQPQQLHRHQHFHVGPPHSIGNVYPGFSMMSPRLSPVFPLSNLEANTGRERPQGFETYGFHLNNMIGIQYHLDLGKILTGEDPRTTLMIKNIPNKYTANMLLACFDEQLKGTYDVFYLPIDFKNKCNVGYAFINMLSPLYIIPFYETFNGKKWEKFNSEKVAHIAYARIQGKNALIAHFQNSSVMTVEDMHCRPIVLNSDSPESSHRMNGPSLQILQPNGSW